MSKQKNQKKFKIRPFFVALMSFLLTLILGEIIVYVLQYLRNDLVDSWTNVMLYIIPSVAVLITVAIFIVNTEYLKMNTKLTHAIDQIADGNFDVEIEYAKRDRFAEVYSDFNKMARELNSVQTLKEDFIHEFSHEFKTPISSINGFANLLLDGEVAEEDKMEVYKIIADESSRLCTLAESSLLMSRIENQQLISESKFFRLDVQLNECIILLSPKWEAKNINVSSELESITYKGDEKLLKAVWTNLIANAVKFTPKNGEIIISAKRQGDHVLVEVKDNGIGISPDEQQKVFEKYYQSPNNKKGGNGLGLAICKSIVELCGGEISVTSALGEGATFKVVLR